MLKTQSLAFFALSSSIFFTKEAIASSFDIPFKEDQVSHFMRALASDIGMGSKTWVVVMQKNCYQCYLLVWLAYSKHKFEAYLEVKQFQQLKRGSVMLLWFLGRRLNAFQAPSWQYFASELRQDLACEKLCFNFLPSAILIVRAYIQARANGKSSETPAPPWDWMALSITFFHSQFEQHFPYQSHIWSNHFDHCNFGSGFFVAYSVHFVSAIQC